MPSIQLEFLTPERAKLFYYMSLVSTHLDLILQIYLSTSVFETFCEREIMEKELNYLRSEIAKIRMEKENAQFSNTG